MKLIHFLGFLVECPENDQRVHFFHFTHGTRRGIFFVSQHSDRAKGLLLAAALTADEEMYTLLVCRAYTLSVYYMCPALLSFEDECDCFLV
jgi:hypothetical protein